MNKLGKPCSSVLDYPGLFFVTPHAHAQMVEQLVLFVCPSVSLNLKHQIPVNRSFMQVFRYNEVCNSTGYKTLNNSLEEIVQWSQLSYL